MNVSKKIITAIAGSALALGFALPALAQSVYGTADTATQVAASASGSASAGSDTSVSSGSGGTSASNNTSASGNATVDGIVNTNLGTGVKGVVKALVGSGSSSSTGSSQGSTGSGSTSGSSDTSGSASGNGSVSVGDNGEQVIFITRGDVDADGGTVVSVSPSSVRTQADLSGFVKAAVQGDDNVSQVEASADNVSVTYKQNAKLFGFIPVTLDATATVDADGNVKISYPWYAFLASTGKADLEGRIQNRVDAVLSADVNANASAQGQTSANAGKNGVVSGNASATGAAEANANAAARLAASTQAKLVAEIKAAMQEEFDATAAANASASAAANASGNANVK